MELTSLAPKITSLKFLKCSFFHVDVYALLHFLFQIFGSTLKAMNLAFGSSFGCSGGTSPIF